MMIALPVDRKDMDSPVSASFGRAPYFMIIGSRSGVPVFVENTAAESQGGAGIKASQLLVDRKVQALIAPRCGENAAMVLAKADIKMLGSIPGTARENIDAFEAGKLEALEDIHPGYHGATGDNQ